MPVARIEDFAIDIGRDPLVGLVRHDVVGRPGIENCWHKAARVDTHLADGGLLAPVVGIVWIVVGVVGYPDMLAAVDVAELVRERRAHDRASRRAVVNETAANTIFAMATATVDALAAGLSQERSAARASTVAVAIAKMVLA